MRLSKVSARLLAAGLFAFLWSSASAPAQVSSRPPVAAGPSGCDFGTMPALPPGADQAPAARRGYDWTPGHYRCTRAGWTWQAGYWRRAGSRVDASVFVTARNGALVPRAGYEFVRQGDGVTVARIAGGGRGGAGIGGTFSCVCAEGAGACGVSTSPDQITCDSQGCQRCKISFVITGASGGLTRYSQRTRLPVFLETNCADNRRAGRAAASL